MGPALLRITDFAVAREGPARAAQPAGDPFDDIVVTARRREESAQSVPVSVTAFSAAALEQRNVRELQDINALTPGFRFAAEGGKNTNTLILRGLAKVRSEEHTSELQSLMRISYAVFCLKKKKYNTKLTD